MANCQLCGENAEVSDQPEGAELCHSCAVYLDAKFGSLGNALCDVNVCDECDGTGIGTDLPACRACGGSGAR